MFWSFGCCECYVFIVLVFVFLSLYCVGVGGWVVVFDGYGWVVLVLGVLCFLVVWVCE